MVSGPFVSFEVMSCVILLQQEDHCCNKKTRVQYMIYQVLCAQDGDCQCMFRGKQTYCFLLSPVNFYVPAFESEGSQ